MYKIYCGLRDDKGVKDSDVARETGITKSTFTDWKNGRSTPKQEKLQKIANYFGVSIETILGSEKYQYDYETHTWEYVIPKEDSDLIEKCMLDNYMSKRLVAYAKKLIELNEMENI